MGCWHSTLQHGNVFHQQQTYKLAEENLELCCYVYFLTPDPDINSLLCCFMFTALLKISTELDKMTPISIDWFWWWEQKPKGPENPHFWFHPPSLQLLQDCRPTMHSCPKFTNIYPKHLCKPVNKDKLMRKTRDLTTSSWWWSRTKRNLHI